jgi:hypothetical protein
MRTKPKVSFNNPIWQFYCQPCAILAMCPAWNLDMACTAAMVHTMEDTHLIRVRQLERM